MNIPTFKKGIIYSYVIKTVTYLTESPTEMCEAGVYQANQSLLFLMKEKCIQQKKMGNMIYTSATERNEDKTY